MVVWAQSKAFCGLGCLKPTPFSLTLGGGTAGSRGGCGGIHGKKFRMGCALILKGKPGMENNEWGGSLLVDNPRDCLRLGVGEKIAVENRKLDGGAVIWIEGGGENGRGQDEKKLKEGLFDEGHSGRNKRAPWPGGHASQINMFERVNRGVYKETPSPKNQGQGLGLTTKPKSENQPRKGVIRNYMVSLSEYDDWGAL